MIKDDNMRVRNKEIFTKYFLNAACTDDELVMFARWVTIKTWRRESNAVLKTRMLPERGAPPRGTSTIPRSGRASSGSGARSNTVKVEGIVSEWGLETSSENWILWLYLETKRWVKDPWMLCLNMMILCFSTTQTTNIYVSQKSYLHFMVYIQHLLSLGWWNCPFPTIIHRLW
jgi:hypothetical protein